MAKVRIVNNFRILSADDRIMYTGGNSWMTREEAFKRVDRTKGEKIYEWQNRVEAF